MSTADEIVQLVNELSLASFMLGSYERKDILSNTGQPSYQTVSLRERREDARQSLRIAIEDLVADAERYRYLCEWRQWTPEIEAAIECGHRVSIDAAIDAARNNKGE